MQALRVTDDIEHLHDSEKCQPCYHHRLLKTEIQIEKRNTILNRRFTNLV